MSFGSNPFGSGLADNPFGKDGSDTNKPGMIIVNFYCRKKKKTNISCDIIYIAMLYSLRPIRFHPVLIIENLGMRVLV